MDDVGLNAAIDAGADFFGMVMADESPRRIDIAIAKHLLAVAGKKIKPVLLLVNPALDEAVYLVKELNPYALQLHGNESPDLCAAIKNQIEKKIIKALPIATKSDFSAVKDYEAMVDYFLFDARPGQDPAQESRHGGLGRAFDWSLLTNYDGRLPFFLAGGLTPDNVGQAITRVKISAPQFFAVDVSSGVEESLAKKSPSKIKKFCLTVKKNFDGK